MSEPDTPQSQGAPSAAPEPRCPPCEGASASASASASQRRWLHRVLSFGLGKLALEAAEHFELTWPLVSKLLRAVASALLFAGGGAAAELATAETEDKSEAASKDDLAKQCVSETIDESDDTGDTGGA